MIIFFYIILFWEPSANHCWKCYQFTCGYHIFWPLQPPSTLKNEVYDSKIQPGTHLWSKNPQKNRNFSVTLTRILCRRIVKKRVIPAVFGPSNPPQPWRMKYTTRKLNQALIYDLRTHKKKSLFSRHFNTHSSFSFISNTGESWKILDWIFSTIFMWKSILSPFYTSSMSHFDFWTQDPFCCGESQF